MQKELNFFQTVPGVVLVTIFILMVPLVAMQFTNEVNWSVSDFIGMGVLIFGAVLAFVLVTRYAANLVYKAAAGSAIGTTLLLVWVNLAVGLIGSGPNAGNLMYIGVIAVVIIGTFLSRFKPEGMQRAMFAAALTLVVLAVIALLTNMDEYAGSSVPEILGVNAFFATLFAISGLLFRYIALEQSPESEQ
jgi:hypothetical protein